MKHHQIGPDFSILVAEKQSSARKLFSDTFKQLGYENVQVIDTLKTVLSYLEAKPESWIICSLDLNEEVNAFQVLKLITTEPRFFKARLSLMFDETEFEMTPMAFSMGATSWHPKDYRPDAVKETFKTFLEQWNDPASIEAKVTSNYLHAALEKTDARQDILSLYKSMSDSFPQDPYFVSKLAIAQFDASLPQEGEETIGLAKLMNAADWQILAEKYLTKGTEPKGRIKTGKIAIIEPDISDFTILKSKFEEFSDAEVHHFVDGAKAWDALAKDASFKLIFMEWKIPVLNGPALVQRIRGGIHKFTPIVLLSTKLQKSDLSLLNELGVGDVLPKPIQTKEFLSTLVSMMGEVKNPQLYRNLECLMLRNLHEGKIEEAERTLRRIWSNTNFSDGHKNYAAALFSYQRKKFSESCERARLSFVRGGDQLKSINLLGQALMRLEDYQGAVKCFRKAQEFSPKNLSRLCAICEAEEELGNDGSSDEALAEASRIDSGNNQVVSLEVKSAINDGNIALAQDLFKHAGDHAHLVAELNNSGVAYIRTGSFDEGIRFYEKTLQSIPETGVEWRMKVSYNLALAYARQNKLDAAYDLLSGLTLDLEIPVAEKIKNLVTRLKRNLKEGSPFALMASESSAPKADTPAVESPWEGSESTKDFGDIPKAEVLGELQAGDRGCYLIFKCTSQQIAKISSYIKEIPQFKSGSEAS